MVLSVSVRLALRRRNVFRKNADQTRFLPRCLVEPCERHGFDKLAMRLKLSRHIPLSAPPATNQVTKRGIADLALHDLLSISHRELEDHQIGIIPNSLGSRQGHEPGLSKSPFKRTAKWTRPSKLPLSIFFR
jgi:hypothetical protein